MPTLHHQIRTAYRHLATRPVPASWTARQPALDRYKSCAELVAAVRGTDRPAEADRVVRALAAIAHHDDDAGTVLVEALVWAMRSRLAGNSSAEFRDDALVELAIVILEADDLDRLDNLAQRLVRRAHSRASRRLQATLSAKALECQIGDAEHHLSSDDDPAVVAADRAHLDETLAIIDHSIQTGQLSPRAWEDCRDGWLAPAAGWRRTQPDRTRTYRGRRAVEAVLAHAS